MESIFIASKRRKRRVRHTGPHIQCGVCKNVVGMIKGQPSPTMVRHEPDNGDVIDANSPACIGMSFPNLAIPVV